LRVTKTVTLEEVTRLARGMTLKNSMMQLPLGGAKSAIRYDPLTPDLEDALVRFFEHIRPMCERMYGWGPDMNTPPDLCDAVARRAGLKSRHMALAETSPYGYEGVANYDKALRLPFGPLTIVDARTAIGVTGAVEAAAKVYGLDRPLRFAVQGFGSVGMGTVYFLTQRGHTVVGIADGSGYYRDPAGLDFEMFHRARAGRREIDPVDLAVALGQHPPTPEQAAVIAAPLGPTLVVAGAGAGKTETMAARVVWLVANGFVGPEAGLGGVSGRQAPTLTPKATSKAAPSEL